MICVSAITIHEYFIFAFNKIDLGTPALSIITCVTVMFSTCRCYKKTEQQLPCELIYVF